ncbi:hypothetical protein O9929_11435 [Vibrio lentus]|nr:hypothetical protein [Vibrio lentus]
MKTKGAVFLFSGHDLHDLERSFNKPKAEASNVYTNGEMLPAHGAELNKCTLRVTTAALGRTSKRIR